MVSKTLEERLVNLLYEGEVEDLHFNESFCGIIYLMKSVVEDDFAKEQFYEILAGKKVEIPSYEDPDYFRKIHKYRARQFGLEFTLKQILRNGQISEESEEEVFNNLINIFKEVINNEEYLKQLYNLDLKDYQEENLIE